jgi:polar amino acid transport system substrate-binding protein
MKRRTLGWLGAALLAAGMGLPFAAAADALDDVMKKKLIRIAVPQDFPPFGSVGTDLKPQGLDIDVAELIARDLGVKLELVPVSSANRIPYLQTNKVEAIISSLGKNPEREKTIDFTSAYAPFFNGVFGPADVKVSKIEEVGARSMGVTRGSVEDIEISKLLPNGNIKRYEDNNSTISAFLSGQVELVATGNVVAAAIIAKNPPRKPETKFLIKNSPCFVGLSKNEPRLLAKLNEIIARSKADGRLDKIAQKWLGLPLPKDL